MFFDRITDVLCGLKEWTVVKLCSAEIDGLVLGGSLLEYYKFDKSYNIWANVDSKGSHCSHTFPHTKINIRLKKILI